LNVSTEPRETMGWISKDNTYKKTTQKLHKLFDYDIKIMELFINKNRRYKIV